MSSPEANWFRVENVAEVPSPSLLVYADRAEANIRRTIAIADGTDRLRPHMKTHKMPELIRLHLGHGITKFKCATIAEAEMTATAGANDILLAYQPVGPNVQRLLQLQRQFHPTHFSCIADDAAAICALSAAAEADGTTIEVLLDIDSGQHRSGVEPGPKAVELYRLIASSPGLIPGGLHAYDGHLHDTDIAVRTRRCNESFAPVEALRKELTAVGLPVPRSVAGGTPTFPIHAKRGDVECSPGTYIFWDFGYGDGLPDLDYQIAALVLTRVVSKPGGNRLCLDLGHKAVAPESPQPRVRLLGLEDATILMQNEEHLVIETPLAAEIQVGDAFYGIPRHICPTVALHSQAVVIRDGKAVERWKVAGRDRQITI